MWGGGDRPGDIPAGRAPWPLHRRAGASPLGAALTELLCVVTTVLSTPLEECALLFCHNFNLNDLGKAGMEVKHHHSYSHTVGHSGEEPG